MLLFIKNNIIYVAPLQLGRFFCFCFKLSLHILFNKYICHLPYKSFIFVYGLPRLHRFMGQREYAEMKRIDWVINKIIEDYKLK